MVVVGSELYLRPPLSPQPSQLWATLTNPEERIVKLIQEDDDDELDELAGDEGKSWHLSTSPCTCASHTPPSLTVLSYGAWKGWR